MMGVLKIDTRRGLYKPIEVEIDGRVYRANKLTRPLFLEMSKLEKSARKGETDSLYKQMQLLFDIDSKTLDKLDIREISAILTHVTENVWKPEKNEPEEEKNGKGPGDESSSS